MNYRVAELMAEKTYDADEVVTVDIDMRDPISEIILKLNTYNSVGNTAPDAHFVAGISKIEIIDGSDVLCSLDGYQAQAIDFYDRDRIRQAWNGYLEANWAPITLGVNFGRYLWDREMAFDASKFTNPQLKVSLDVGAGGVTSTELRLKVLANAFDERTASPRGFLMNKEVKEYTVADTEHEYTDLPTDYKYRKMFVQARTPGTEPDRIIDTLKLTEEHDRKIPFNSIDFEDLFRAIGDSHPVIHKRIMQWANNAASSYGYCIPTNDVSGSVTSYDTPAEAQGYNFKDGDGGRFEVTRYPTAGTVVVNVQGNVPHGVYEIPFGDPLNEADWYDVTKIKSLVADIYGDGTGTCKIFLQQYRPY